MNSFNSGARPFWIEAYGGRPYRVERKTDPDPIVVPQLAVAVYGGTQPDKLARLLREGDDGLLARLLWAWPESIPFRLGKQPPRIEWAIRALDRLRELDLHSSDDPPRPILVPLAAEARGSLQRLAQDMQRRQQEAGPLLRSALGKVRGQVLRLSLVLELLRWCGEDGVASPPSRIGPRAFASAAVLIDGYFLPMAARAYGDAQPTARESNAAVLARWIVNTCPEELYPRHLQREVRLPGLRTAQQIRDAAEALVVSGWLCSPDRPRQFGPRSRLCYRINPRLRSKSGRLDCTTDLGHM